MKKRISGNVFAVIASLLFAGCQSDGDNVRKQALEQNQKVRLAKLVIDSTQLESYKAALKEEIEASVRLEPGILTLYAVSEKTIPRTSPFWKYTRMRRRIKRICKHRTS